MFYQAFVSFVDQALKGISQRYNVEILEKCQTITQGDVVTILQKYFIPLFDPPSSVAFVVTEPYKADEICEALSSIGFNVSKRTLEMEREKF
jgi:hypothetical protein